MPESGVPEPGVPEPGVPESDVPGILVVVALAGSALFEDSGRRHVDSGVPVSGAFDRYAHAAATALMGGSTEQATLEIVGSIELEAPGTGAIAGVTCAVTGRATVTLDGRAATTWTVLQVPAAGRLTVHAEGRAYLAVAGGFRPGPELGSRSTCLLGPIGPPPVGTGDRLPLGRDRSAGHVGDFVRPPAARSSLRVVVGPHLALAPCDVEVVAASRIGVRLSGGRLRGGGRPVDRMGSAIRSDLPSLGVLPGTLQVLPSGDWMILGPDSGTMGGYPVAGVVLSGDLDLLAHARPGDRLHLSPVETWHTAAIPRVTVVRISGLGS